MQDDGPYAAAWARYRRASRAFWILFVLFLPALALVGRAVRSSTPGGRAVIFGTAIAWMIAFTVAGYYTGNFSCPRCGQPFFRRFDDRPWRQSWIRNPFARKCLHCGLPKRSAVDVKT